MFLRLSLLFLALGIAGCKKIPSDPGHSFVKATGTGLVVGYSDNPPWVIGLENEAEGVEGYLIRKFANSNGMDIIWHKGSDQKLMKMLEDRELHIVISGLTKDNPWKSKKIGMTLPYYKAGKEKHIIAAQQGENRLIMNLETFLHEHKDSIKKKQTYNETFRISRSKNGDVLPLNELVLS